MFRERPYVSGTAEASKRNTGWYNPAGAGPFVVVGVHAPFPGRSRSRDGGPKTGPTLSAL